MAGVRLKGNGQLLEFYAVPPENDPEVDEPTELGWERLSRTADVLATQGKTLRDFLL